MLVILQILKLCFRLDKTNAVGLPSVHVQLALKKNYFSASGCRMIEPYFNAPDSHYSYLFRINEVK